MARRLADDLSAIGCQVYVDGSAAQTGSQTGNLYCTLPATGPGEPLLLSAHMDTVVPGTGVRPVLEGGVIRSQGDTVLGSDDKSGIAAIVEALRTAVEENLPHPELQLVFTVCEELDLGGSRSLEYDRITPRRAVVLDSDGDAGTIITSAPGLYKIKAAVVGRRAHAGMAPETGISAVQALCHAVANMKLLRIDEDTTANVGTISALGPTNIVSPRAELLAEARSRDTAKLQAQAQHMMDCLEQACQTFGATLEGGILPACTAYALPDDHPLVLEVASACRRVGLEPVLAASGGISDANSFNTHGIAALVLGTGMSKVHTTQEEITVKNLEDTAALVLALITG